MKILHVTECSDPYEPSATVATFSSIEKAKEAGFIELWFYERRVEVDVEGCGKIEKGLWRDAISGSEYLGYGADYPQPVCEWAEMDLAFEQ